MGSREIKPAYSAREVAELVRVLGSDGALCPIVVKGTSMVPTLREGRDTVYLRAIGPHDEVRVGDIAFFWRGPQVVLHRVAAVRTSGLVRMNGDGQLWCEDIARDQIFAVVERVQRGTRSLPVRRGIIRVWGLFWLRLLPVRERLWHLPRPLKRAVRRAGGWVRGGGAYE